MPTSTDRADSNRDASPPRLAMRGTLLLGLVALLLLSFLPLQPPEPVGLESPASGFSAERAFEHVKTMAAKPHAIGSEAHARVRDEIVRRLETLGLEAQVHQTLAARLWRGTRVRTAWVENVLARLEGSAGTDDAVLLVAHYDSVPNGFGAADDAAGVAALLESLRALRESGPHRHDVIALFTDAEEWGLLGAEGFLHDHPWAQDVRLVLNFEARGVSGPSIMFETGAGTGPLLRRFARAAPRPLAASYSYDVYRRLPNDTDFTLFKARDLPGFNFAFIGGSGKYHTVLDTPGNLSRGSLQHHGDYALEVTRHFAAAEDLPDLPRGGPATYFALPWIGLVVYPSAWALPLAGLLALAVVGLWAAGRHKQRVSLKATAGAALLTVVSVALATAVVVLLHRFVAAPLGLDPGRLARPGTYLLGWMFLVAALVTAGLLLVYRGRRADRLAGIALVWALLAVVTAVAAPSTSYLMAWPLAGLALLLGTRTLGGKTPTTPAVRTLLLLAAALPALWLWPPTLHLVGDAFGAAGIGPLVTALMAGLLTTLLIPQLETVAGLAQGRRWLPAVLGGLGVLTLGVAAATAGYGPENPRPTQVLYVLDADSGEARWATVERQLSAWTRQFFEDGGERASVAPFVPASWPDLRVAPAPVAPLPAPEIELVESRKDAEGRRRVRLTLRSPLGGMLLKLLISSDSPLVGWRLAGRELEVPQVNGEGAHPLEVLALPGEGLSLELILDGDAPLEIDAVDEADGLPEIAGFPWEPRPDRLMPSRNVPTDRRMVRKQYHFETTPPEASEEDGGST